MTKMDEILNDVFRSHAHRFKFRSQTSLGGNNVAARHANLKADLAALSDVFQKHRGFCPIRNPELVPGPAMTPPAVASQARLVINGCAVSIGSGTPGMAERFATVLAEKSQ